MLAKDFSEGLAEYITELTETDSLATLHKAYSQKSPLVFKLDQYPHPIKTGIDHFLDKRAVLQSDLKNLKIPDKKEVSITFNVGTEVFFIKTIIKSHLNRYYFDMSSRVLQLQRRSEPRFLIPKKWNQTGFIITNPVKSKQPPFTVIDISLSGLRLEVRTPNLISDCKNDDVIKIKFQIYKRAEITTRAVVRHALHNPEGSSFLGLEFAKMPTLDAERVSSIIEDIALFNSANKI